MERSLNRTRITDCTSEDMGVNVIIIIVFANVAVPFSRHSYSIGRNIEPYEICYQYPPKKSLNRYTTSGSKAWSKKHIESLGHGRIEYPLICSGGESMNSFHPMRTVRITRRIKRCHHLLRFSEIYASCLQRRISTYMELVDPDSLVARKHQRKYGNERKLSEL